MKLTSGQIKNSSLVAGSTITDALNTLRTSSGSGTGDMVKAVYDTDNDGKVDVANLADSVPWTGVTDKPVTFTPALHNHPVSEVTGLQSALDGKANSTHTHAISDVTGLQTALDGKASSTHAHAISDVTGLQTALDSKQDVLVSGVNIKTINSESLLGSGNIVITGGGGGGGSIATDIHAATSKTTPADADELGITDSAASWGLKKLTFANLKAWIGGLFVSKSGDTINGNLNFIGAGRRITGDFSNATVADRLLFQTNQPNTATIIGVIPSGSGTESRLILINNSDTANASGLDFRALTAEMQIRASNHGAGLFSPLTFHVGGAERLRINTSGNVLATSGALGYGPGAGGQVTQDTSKSTAVTLNKPVGRIITAGDSLAAGDSVNFVLNNSHIGIGDIVLVVASGGATGKEYQAWVSYVTNGQCVIHLKNNSTGALSQTVGINFAIIKGALT